MNTSSPGNTRDYSAQTPAELISRITLLEGQLRAQTALLATYTATLTPQALATSSSAFPLPLQQAPHTSSSSTAPAPARPSRRTRTRSRSASPSRRAKPFDPSAYSTRHIALKFAYLGQRYGGYEHANGNVTPQPTVEEVLWKALRKARLIAPPLVTEGAGPEVDESYDVVWGAQERRDRYVKSEKLDPRAREGQDGNKRLKLELSWEGCQYSKCGRTDRGVSAFGQVIGIRVRSNRPLVRKVAGEEEVREKRQDIGNDDVEDAMDIDTTIGDMILDPLQEEEDAIPAPSTSDLTTSPYDKPFDPIEDELPYISLLNSLLPPDIRVLAWCPSPPPTFDARFSCRERRYKYFFTNPAFCPTPGPRGFIPRGGGGSGSGNGIKNDVREGWLDVEKMKQAAKKLEGLHDFRNFCKIDASKQMPNCVRRVTFADVVEWDGSAKEVTRHPGLSEHPSSSSSSGLVQTLMPEVGRSARDAGEPKVYTFCVHGSAFLWHQVRCMVAVLFLVGQGLEDPSVVDDLLDVEKNPGRPTYEMADDAPLVLWDCIFPDKDPEGGEEMVDAMQWVYAGDAVSVPAMSTNPMKSDGKFGVGAMVDELWTQWREAKIQETLAGSLLDLAISQGDGSSFTRVATANQSSRAVKAKSQRVFDGSSRARIQGKYIPVLNKPRMDTLEVLNAKWLKSRTAKRAQLDADRQGRDFEETNAEE